jgi:cellulose synthase/poly-beta-1,6-N-acetylglucosamine synthase-like glycosyltransferase
VATQWARRSIFTWLEKGWLPACIGRCLFPLFFSFFLFFFFFFFTQMTFFLFHFVVSLPFWERPPIVAPFIRPLLYGVHHLFITGAAPGWLAGMMVPGPIHARCMAPTYSIDFLVHVLVSLFFSSLAVC